jgi:DNA-binding NtrC family response regulator
MARRDLLEGKRILIVDDEPDVLETLADLLSMCEVFKATSFQEAREKLDQEFFDLVILDIMGVDGYRLLEIANQKGVMALMLTAHALSPEDTVKSYQLGAASYVPKEKMADIATYLEDILEAKEEGKSPWWRWMDRFGSYYDRKFSPDWKQKDKEFWERFQKRELI